MKHSFCWKLIPQIVVISFLPAINSFAQVGDEIQISDTCSYFGKAVPESVILFNSDSEAEEAIGNIVDVSGLIQNFVVRAAGVPNAATVIRGSQRFILYSQYFMQNIKRSTGSTWGPISIMAHEIGHHLNGHTLTTDGSRPKIELEADYFSGFILQRMGASLDESRVAMQKLGSETGSETHPARHNRLAAITNGWSRSCSSDPNCSQAGKASPQTDKPKPVPERSPSRPQEERKPHMSLAGEWYGETGEARSSCGPEYVGARIELSRGNGQDQYFGRISVRVYTDITNSSCRGYPNVNISDPQVSDLKVRVRGSTVYLDFVDPSLGGVDKCRLRGDTISCPVDHNGERLTIRYKRD